MQPAKRPRPDTPQSLDPSLLQGTTGESETAWANVCYSIFSFPLIPYQLTETVFSTFRQQLVDLLHQFSVLFLAATSSTIRKIFEVRLWSCEVKFLGHVVTTKGVAVDLSKVEAVMNWQGPKSMFDIHSFIGLAGYYRKFIKNFPLIVLPMIRLTPTGVKFVWDEKYAEAF